MLNRTEKYTHEFNLNDEEIIVELFVEKDEAGNIVYWNFFINNIEEMSLDIAGEYETAFMSLLLNIVPALLLKDKNIEWLTVGGADYQLQKYQRIGKNNNNLIVDPLCGKLKDLFGIIDPEVAKLSRCNEIPLKFSDYFIQYFPNGPSKIFDISVIDVSDYNEFSGFDSPKEAYTEDFYKQICSITKIGGYIIAYEGTSDTLSQLSNEVSSLAYVDGLKPIQRVSCGYGFMSLWKVLS
jgi:hypothetical protein